MALGIVEFGPAVFDFLEALCLGFLQPLPFARAQRFLDFAALLLDKGSVLLRVDLLYVVLQRDVRLGVDVLGELLLRDCEEKGGHPVPHCAGAAVNGDVLGGVGDADNFVFAVFEGDIITVFPFKGDRIPHLVAIGIFAALINHRFPLRLGKASLNDAQAIDRLLLVLRDREHLDDVLLLGFKGVDGVGGHDGFHTLYLLDAFEVVLVDAIARNYLDIH